PPSRRSILTGAASALAATTVTAASTAAGGSVTDPCLVIGAERDRLKTIHDAMVERVRAIAEANPAPMWGQGCPRVDLSNPVLHGLPWEDGYNLNRDEIEQMTFFREPSPKREALLAWWDGEHAAMDRRGIETGYKQANEELDAMTVRLI